MHRRGSYTVLMALLLGSVLSFGALALDVSLIRLAHSQAQDVADAAAFTAMLELNRTGSEILAQEAAEQVIAANTVIGTAPALLNIDFGGWNSNTQSFDTNGTVNAVQVQVGRVGANAVGMILGALFDWGHLDIRATATAATQDIEVVLVLDITTAWQQEAFAGARTGVLDFLTARHQQYGAEDRLGMVVYLDRYGWEYSPMTLIGDSAGNSSLLQDPWGLLNIGSLAGDYRVDWSTGSYLSSKYLACNVYGTDNEGGDPNLGWCSSGGSCYQPGNIDDFTASTPTGGCFVDMPRYYSDETGHDPGSGLRMADQMLQELSNPSAYKVMIVLNAGQAAGFSSAGQRAVEGFSEGRFREYNNPDPHSTIQIEDDTPTLVQSLAATSGVNVWFISYAQGATFMEASIAGDGWYVLTSDPADISTELQAIAHSFPITVVK